MYVLREVHEGICGNHLGPQSLVGKVVGVGYFWPTVQKDAIRLSRRVTNASSLRMCSMF